MTRAPLKLAGFDPSLFGLFVPLGVCVPCCVGAGPGLHVLFRAIVWVAGFSAVCLLFVEKWNLNSITLQCRQCIEGRRRLGAFDRGTGE